MPDQNMPVLSDNGEMSDRWFVFIESTVCLKHKGVGNYKIIYGLSWITILLSREAICQWLSHVTVSLVKTLGDTILSCRKSLFTASHTLFYSQKSERRHDGNFAVIVGAMGWHNDDPPRHQSDNIGIIATLDL